MSIKEVSLSIVITNLGIELRRDTTQTRRPSAGHCFRHLSQGHGLSAGGAEGWGRGELLLRTRE